MLACISVRLIIITVVITTVVVVVVVVVVVAAALSLTVRRGRFFQCAARSWFFFLINDLIKTSTSGICRSPDPLHLNVPEHVKNISK